MKKAQRTIRSPLFYVGDKYKLMPQLKNLFPQNIKTFYDVFCGGGSASLNIVAESYVLNDINDKIIELHQFLQEQANDIEQFIESMHKLINKYGLSLSEIGKNNEIENLKKVHIKTYFSKYNKEPYMNLRTDYNKNQSKTELLYLLLIYGFNHMIRFNAQGQFNLPVGNVDWNKNVSAALRNYASWIAHNTVKLSKGLDFEAFVLSQTYKKGDFIYFDPPYLITFSDYNKLWNEAEEYRLYALLDKLSDNGIYWGLSNMLYHKEKTNTILKHWAEKYIKYDIDSNYISRFDNSIKKQSKELFVTNYNR